MTGAEGLAAAFVGGVLTSASPCVLAAVPVAVGALVIAAAPWLWRSQAVACGLRLPAALEQQLARSGLWGAALLLAYGLGHSALLLVAGAMPGAASALMQRFASAQAWLPGRRSFALILAAAGLWWVAQGLGIVV